MNIEIQSHSCDSCGSIASKDWQPGDLCTDCGGAVRSENICVWCSHTVPHGNFCRNCGFEMVEPRWYGAARMLKDSGIDKFSLKSRLNELSDADKLHHQQQYMRHYVPIINQLNQVSFCQKYLDSNEFVNIQQQELLEQAPFPEKQLESFANGLQGPYNNGFQSLLDIYQGTNMTLVQDLAAMAILLNCPLEWAQQYAQEYVHYFVKRAYKYKALRVQALMTLSNWRFETAVYEKHIRRSGGLVDEYIRDAEQSDLTLGEKVKIENLRYLNSATIDEAIMQQGLHHKDRDVRILATIRLKRSDLIREFINDADDWQSQYLMKHAASWCNEQDIAWLPMLNDEQIHYYVRYTPSILPEVFIDPLIEASKQHPQKREYIWNTLSWVDNLSAKQLEKLESIAVQSTDILHVVKAFELNFFTSHKLLSKKIFQHAVKTGEYRYLLKLIEINKLHDISEVLCHLKLSEAVLESLRGLAEKQLFSLEFIEKLISYAGTSSEYALDCIVDIIFSQQDIDDKNKNIWFLPIWHAFVSQSPLFEAVANAEQLLGFEHWNGKESFQFTAAEIEALFTSTLNFEQNLIKVMQQKNQQSAVLLSWLASNNQRLDDYLGEHDEFASQLYEQILQASAYDEYDHAGYIITANKGFKNNVLLAKLIAAGHGQKTLYLFASTMGESSINAQLLLHFSRILPAVSNDERAIIGSFIEDSSLTLDAYKFLIDHALCGENFWLAFLPEPGYRITFSENQEYMVDSELLCLLYPEEDFEVVFDKILDAVLNSKQRDITLWFFRTLASKDLHNALLKQSLQKHIKDYFAFIHLKHDVDDKFYQKMTGLCNELFAPALNTFFENASGEDLQDYYQFLSTSGCHSDIYNELVGFLSQATQEKFLAHLIALIDETFAFEKNTQNHEKILLKFLQTKLNQDDTHRLLEDDEVFASLHRLFKLFFTLDFHPDSALCQYFLDMLLDAYKQNKLGDNLHLLLDTIRPHRESEFYFRSLRDTFDSYFESPEGKAGSEDCISGNDAPQFTAPALSAEQISGINEWIMQASTDEAWAESCVDYYRSYKDPAVMTVLAMMPDKLNELKSHPQAYDDLLNIGLEAVKDRDLYDENSGLISHGSLVVNLLSEYLEDEACHETIQKELTGFIENHQLGIVHESSLQDLYEDKNMQWPANE